MTQITAVCDLGHNRKAKLPDGATKLHLQKSKTNRRLKCKNGSLVTQTYKLPRSGMERGRLEARAGNLPGARKAITTPSQQFIALSNWERIGSTRRLCTAWRTRQK